MTSTSFRQFGWARTIDGVSLWKSFLVKNFVWNEFFLALTFRKTKSLAVTRRLKLKVSKIKRRIFLGFNVRSMPSDKIQSIFFLMERFARKTNTFRKGIILTTLLIWSTTFEEKATWLHFFVYPALYTASLRVRMKPTLCKWCDVTLYKWSRDDFSHERRKYHNQ